VKFPLDHDVPDDLSYLPEQLGHDVTLLRRRFSFDFPAYSGCGCHCPRAAQI